MKGASKMPSRFFETITQEGLHAFADGENINIGSIKTRNCVLMRCLFCLVLVVIVPRYDSDIYYDIYLKCYITINREIKITKNRDGIFDAPFIFITVLL
jgi:hypothetical protein